MILVFDVGNTETTVGLFEGADLRGHWRLGTDPSRTTDEVGLLLRGLLDSAGHAPAVVTGAAVGSVVPAVTPSIVEACALYFGADALVVDASAALPIHLDVEEPLTVGADRLINTLVASHQFRRDVIVVDLGTATTFDCITADGVFLGGVIAPGVRTSAETLFRRTSKLPATELVAPVRTIGRNTEECIRSGVMFGAAESIDGVVRRIVAEWPRPERPMVIGTGGLAELFAPLCTSFDVVDPYLTLRGLAMAFALLGEAS